MLNTLDIFAHSHSKDAYELYIQILCVYHVWYMKCVGSYLNECLVMRELYALKFPDTTRRVKQHVSERQTAIAKTRKSHLQSLVDTACGRAEPVRANTAHFTNVFANLRMASNDTMIAVASLHNSHDSAANSSSSKCSSSSSSSSKCSNSSSSSSSKCSNSSSSSSSSVSASSSRGSSSSSSSSSSNSSSSSSSSSSSNNDSSSSSSVFCPMNDDVVVVIVNEDDGYRDGTAEGRGSPEIANLSSSNSLSSRKLKIKRKAGAIIAFGTRAHNKKRT